MGLDQYAGLRDSKGEVHEKFYWRKHARLQVFMAKQFNKQKKEKEHNTHGDLQHLGFNGGEGGVTITEDVIKELKSKSKMIIGIVSLVMGSFGVSNSKKSKLKNTKPRTKSF